MRQTPHVDIVYVRLLTVLPIALGAWSMALVLWQSPEYYYAARLLQNHLLSSPGAASAS